MKKYISTIIVIFLAIASNLSYAQNWTNNTYDYRIDSNVSYGKAIDFAGDTITLTMDIYTPICPYRKQNNKFPLAIWIHGGAFLTGTKNDQTIVALCKKFAQHGYVSVAINYRKGMISDEALWQCNFPNYNCIFATDSAEWYRAYHRAIQDANGALRYFVNRNINLQIDAQNIFVGGESAGALAALGVGLMDTATDRLPQSYALADANPPNNNNLACEYNIGKTFGNTIARPDLGDFWGDIEPTNEDFTIKGIASIYGAMPLDLLKYTPNNKPKPAIYNFHQPCDIVVPIDSNNVFWGLTWCMNNGYNCYGIANSAFKLYGPRAFSLWNTNNNYGYNIHNDFTTTTFPYSFLIGQASCVDQANNPCHAYDNFQLRSDNIFNFFAPLITNNQPCDTSSIGIIEHNINKFKLYPNPAKHIVNIEHTKTISEIAVYNLLGQILLTIPMINQMKYQINTIQLPSGIYQIVLKDASQQYSTQHFIKE